MHPLASTDLWHEEEKTQDADKAFVIAGRSTQNGPRSGDENHVVSCIAICSIASRIMEIQALSVPCGALVAGPDDMMRFSA
jgi:hypothetical protein